jgi:pimeloyl-ACP methyl ester carboxylesterase
MPHICLFDNQLQLEYAFFEPEVSEQTPVNRLKAPTGITTVLLHEGLGSVSLWKSFPQQLANTLGSRVLAYSRLGYGRSSALTTARQVDFMHTEATVVLPVFLKALQLTDVLLIGHSDGATIALLAAAQWSRKHFESINLSGVVAMAPHLFVENICIDAIAATTKTFSQAESGLRQRLVAFHDDVDGAFFGWSNIWLSADFRSWNISAQIQHIHCPVLAIQGEQDQYGTMQQIEELARQAPQTHIAKLNNCRHSPHSDQPLVVLKTICEWLALQ